MQRSNALKKAVFAVAGETRKEQVANAAKEVVAANEFIQFEDLRNEIQFLLPDFNIRTEFLGECLRKDPFFAFYKDGGNHVIYRAEIINLLKKKREANKVIPFRRRIAQRRTSRR